MTKSAKKSCRPRYLLILELGQQITDIASELAHHNWHCLTATSVDCAMTLAKQYPIHVAIAQLTPTCQTQVFSTITRLKHAGHTMQWVAITSTPCNNTTKFRHSLPEYFIDYHHLPLDWHRLDHTLGHANGMAELMPPTGNSSITAATLPPLLGKGKLIRDLNAKIERVAYVDNTILLSGETGTGKGLCARWIHALSARHAGPMISVNCGALPPSLIHSALFGHEKGAFTGADQRYLGHIERAHKGTLFLDEIADLPIELQVNLLQFIEDCTIERIGGSQPIEVDCRIIFATHQNLETAIEEGRFREDLYHRINILRLHMPSLREYQEDIMLLANIILKECTPADAEFHFSPSAIQAMQAYDWPGNIREMKNRIQRAVVMSDTPRITESALGIAGHSKEYSGANLAEQRTVIDTEVLLRAIERNNHNISAAARELNISRTTFYRLVRKCHIDL
ncbi:sigma-54 dependent transcriptional regulator [Shewanella salipaludis]|uniref:Sigma-54-dependent Fis family transcriptional regulator n=1 Tax=Shewanella salipaludis TaxID=2723052 RepID=A0A972JHY3_9GAMM|nr:sigma-54 dependent transcriptional regulator [Shewanella salipaludis]NMH63605.1 sigma-54-dependent Fis family transcriptional regulator [Shewanella salipaludis]